MATVSFKLTDDQLRRLRRSARARAMSVSDYLRKSALSAEKKGAQKPLHRRHPVSGLIYNAAPGQLSPSRAEIEEALADFP